MTDHKNTEFLQIIVTHVPQYSHVNLKVVVKWLLWLMQSNLPIKDTTSCISNPNSHQLPYANNALHLNATMSPSSYVA
jgi:hypothetical protein